MVRTLIVGNKGPAGINASTTAYRTVAQSFVGGGSTTETFARIPWRTAGTFTNLYIRITANDRGASTLTFRINGANGNQSVSIGASSTGEFEDTTNSDTVATGDLVAAAITTGAGGTTFADSLLSVIFTPSASVNDAVARTAAVNNSISTDSTTFYSSISGAFLNSTTTEADQQFSSPSAFTLRNLYAGVGSNGRSTTSTLRVRVNGANGNGVISIGAGATGSFEDTTNTDVIAATNLVNLSLTLSTGGGTLAVDTIATEVYSSKGQTLFKSSRAGGSVIAASTTTNLMVAGIVQPTATESETPTDANSDFVASQLHCYVSANGVTATSTLKLRKNAANDNNSVSIPASSTGHFEDASSTDVIVPTDEINFQLVTGATGTTLTIRSTTLLLSIARIFTPSPIVVPILTPAPAISATLTPSPIAIPILVSAPAISSGAVTLTPSPIAVSILVPAPAISAGAIPSPIAVPILVPTPTISSGAVTLTPSPIAVLILTPAPAISSGAVTLTPSPIDVPILTPAPAIAGSAITLTPSPIVVPILITVPIIVGGSIIAPTSISVPILIPSPAITFGSVTLTPTPVAVSVLIPAPIIVSGFIIAPSPVIVPILTPSPLVISPITLSPSPVAILLVLPSPLIPNVPEVVAPDPLAILLTIPTISLLVLDENGILRCLTDAELPKRAVWDERESTGVILYRLPR